MPRRGLGKLNRYGELMVRSLAGCGDLVVRVEGLIARSLDGDGARLDCGMTPQTREDAAAA